MVDKNIVDDYYSNIPKSSTASDKSWATKWVKLKAKKKIIKKPVKKVVSEDTSDVKDSTEIVPKTKQEKVVTKKSVPSTWMRVVRPKQVPQKTFVKKPYWQQRDKPTAFRKDTQTSAKKPGVVEAVPAYKKVKKTFGENAQKSTNSKYSNSKSSHLKPFSKRSKYGRNNYMSQIDENEFARSKKAVKKKQEKNIEDIKQDLVARTGQTVTVGWVLTLKELSEKIGVTLVQLIAEFMKNWMMVNINSKIDFESASIVAGAFDVVLKKDDAAWISVEDLLSWDISELLEEDDDSVLQERPPVVSIMGHVDHGKTSLLDYIRESAVTDIEAGWITQSIGAYQVEKNWKKVTFLDTPGHEAFTVMRSRWAKSTDIAILVVAADEWVKPQTIESISHAKEAGIPVVVAINKMDKEWANPDHVKWQLAEKWLTPEDWGWDTPMVPVSAKTWFWIDDLIEILLLVAEMKELKANVWRSAVATVIESHLDLKLWPVSTVLINTWTLNKWDIVVCNDAFWKVKVLKNYESKNIKKALPWDPVLIVWLDKVAEWGDVLQVMSDPSKAKQKANEYRDIMLAKKRNQTSGLEVLMSRIKAWNLKQLKLVVKADTNGSLEALKSVLVKLSTAETNVVIIHSGVWNITEWDVLMSDGSEAVLIWFWVEVVPTAKKALGWSAIEFIDSKIIYHITERIEKIVSGMLDPKEVETILWEAKVGGVFYTSKEFMVLGLILKEWNNIQTKTKVRVIRNWSKVWEWKIISLKSWIEEVKALEGPVECGIKFEWSMQPEMWDMLEVYKVDIVMW